MRYDDVAENAELKTAAKAPSDYPGSLPIQSRDPIAVIRSTILSYIPSLGWMELDIW